MPQTSATLLGTLAGLLVFDVVAQQGGLLRHAGAEEAMEKIVLEKDFGELKFHLREFVTMAQNDRVPGLNGLMFMRWKGDTPGTEVMASVQWFEEKEDLIDFYAKSTKRADHELGKLGDTILWEIGESGYLWTDGEHFLVSLGGSPTPSPEMVNAWLELIASEVAAIEEDTDNKGAQGAEAEK